MTLTLRLSLTLTLRGSRRGEPEVRQMYRGKTRVHKCQGLAETFRWTRCLRVSVATPNEWPRRRLFELLFARGNRLRLPDRWRQDANSLIQLRVRWSERRMGDVRLWGCKSPTFPFKRHCAVTELSLALLLSTRAWTLATFNVVLAHHAAAGPRRKLQHHGL